jgi:hypothetical protein
MKLRLLRALSAELPVPRPAAGGLLGQHLPRGAGSGRAVLRQVPLGGRQDDPGVHGEQLFLLSVQNNNSTHN